MNLLFINHTSNMSGAEHVLKDYLENENRHNKILLAPSGPFKEVITDLNITTYETKGLGELNRVNHKFWLISFLKKYIRTAIDVIKIIRRNDIQLVYANTFTSCLYALIPVKLLNKHLIWHMHDIFKKNSLEAKVARFMGGKVDSIIAVSHAVERYLTSVGVNKNKIDVIYNGIDSKRKYNPDQYEKNVETQERIVITMVGLLTEWKGFHILIESIGMLDRHIREKIEIKIVGDHWNTEEYMVRLKKLVEFHQLEHIVHFLGRRGDIPSIMKDSDLVIHASTWEDPLPTVVLEAMSMRKLVIASNVGGVPEIITDHYNGFTFTPEDSLGLARKIEFVISEYLVNPSPLNRIRNNARDTILNKFTPERKMDQVDSVIKKFDQ